MVGQPPGRHGLAVDPDDPPRGAAHLDPDAQLLALDLLREEAARGAGVVLTLHDLGLRDAYVAERVKAMAALALATTIWNHWKNWPQTVLSYFTTSLVAANLTNPMTGLSGK